MRRFFLPFLIGTFALLLQPTSLLFVEANDESAAAAAPVIPNQYIVYYNKNADRAATNERLFFSPTSSVASSESFRVLHQMHKAIVVAGINEEQVQELLKDPSVLKIVPDFEVSINAVQTDPSSWDLDRIDQTNLPLNDSYEYKQEVFTSWYTYDGTSAQVESVTTVQSDPPNWGLDRIDQTNLPLDNSYEYKYDGTGVQVYIFGGGIRKSHQEFGDRATCGANFVPEEDCDDTTISGLGTHAAGIVGGSTYGVAKGVTLIDVKVIGANGNGPWSTSFAAFEYVVNQKNMNPSTPMVIYMSTGSNGVVRELKDAVDEAVEAGIVVVVFAGNSGVDACTFTPAFIPSAITVGYSNIDDTRGSVANFGDCVDLFAPGVAIVSAMNTGDQDTATYSGSGMAASHVAGAAALYLQANPQWTPAQVWNAMRNDAAAEIQRTFVPLENYFRNRRTTNLILQTQHII